jgi:DNA polymerase elongation subunit (family B)
MKALAMEENVVLFGVDPTPGIVAVESVGDRLMRLFLREGDRLTTRDEPFTPFLLLEDDGLLQGLQGSLRVESLSGKNAYRYLVLFGAWGDCLKARDQVQKKTGHPSSSPQAPYLFLPDPVHQYLVLTGKTLFKGLPFKSLHRLALDIETACAPGYEFSNPHREEDRILSVALMDNQGYSEVLFGRDMGEKDMLRVLGERIGRLDPDVLEGHNLFNFDLEYLVARAKMHQVRLLWGRGGKEPRIRRSRFSVAERIIDYTRVELFGRHVVDTLFLLQYYDVTAREMESYGLKAAAIHFGLADEERTYIDREKIQWTYEHDPEALKRYNLDDVRETLALSDLLGYSFFLQARIFPFSYQNIFVRGNATKINGLFLREYLRQLTSIPKPTGRGTFEGGYTDVFQEGLVRNVVHCDVASLYPSLMLAYDLKPSGDTLDVFLPLLRDLRNFRLDAKRKTLEARDPHERDYFQALQQTFKVLINSFYGYLGTELHAFSDPQAAGEVTRVGREILRQMLEWLREQGALPVELDTDGIYFVPPPGVETEPQAQALVERLSRTLPEGIEVEMDGLYPAMFSYKRKNYALLDPKGQMSIKGSALRSRGMEKYLREFLSAMLRLLLEGKGEEVRRLIEEYQDRIAGHQMEIGWLAKTETLTESPEHYRQKVETRKRNPAATYELALASERPYRAGDQVSFYVTGTKKNVRVYENAKLASDYDPAHPDVNVAYYQAKLMELVKKYQGFLPLMFPGGLPLKESSRGGATP